ncbi:MAG: SDR family NAD(P)-dependent oxidoreductase [Helicobacter sp.]|nr:SDR family NAD(P)-dependent oxidoreductase [Helicobacter sp.]
MKRFEDKVAIVSGAGTGIGRAVAQRFAAKGAKVLILGRTEQTLQECTQITGILENQKMWLRLQYFWLLMRRGLLRDQNMV